MKSISINAQFIGNNGQIDVQTFDLSIKDKSSECTLLEWSKLEMLLAENVDLLEKPNLDLEAYQTFLIQAISIFVVNSNNTNLDLASLPLSELGADSLCSLFEMIVRNVRSYEPAKHAPASGQPFIFCHKGQYFAIPPTWVDALGKPYLIARDMTFREATEGLMAEQRYAQEYAGKPKFEHAKYHTSLWLLAAMCRKANVCPTTKRVLGFEEVPTKTSEWHDLIMNRLDLFSDISMEIGLQVNFFLQTSKNSYKNTTITSTSTMFQLLTQILNQVPLNGNLVG